MLDVLIKATVPPSVGLSHALLRGLEGAGTASQGSVGESARGAQGLDVLEEEGGAIQGLPITGVLERTAAKTGTICCKGEGAHSRCFD